MNYSRDRDWKWWLRPPSLGILLALATHSTLAADPASLESLCSRVATMFDAGRLPVLIESGRQTDTAIRVDLGDSSGPVFVTATGGDLLVVDSNGKEVELFDSESVVEYGSHLAVVRVARQVYLLDSNEKQLNRLTRITVGAKPTVLCEYEWNERTSRNRALDEYGRLLLAAKRRNQHPFEYVLDRRDTSGLRLLVARDRDINEALASNMTPLAYAIWMFEKMQPDDLAVIDLMLQMGADPDRKAEIDSALSIAVRHGKYDLALRLMRHTKTVESLDTGIITTYVKSPETAGKLLREHARVARVIEENALLYASAHDNRALLRYFAESGFPVIETHHYWLNGVKIRLPPSIIRRVHRLDDAALRDALLALPSQFRRPAHMSDSADYMLFETGTKVLLVKESLRLKPPQVAPVKEFATSVCVHLVGGVCGPPEAIDQALRWMRSLPQDCPPELARVYDTPVCILAQEYARGSRYEMFMGPSADKALPFVRAMQQIGVRSIARD